MEAANMSEKDEVLLIQNAIELAKAARDMLQSDMKLGTRPKDFALLQQWNKDIQALEEHLEQA